MQRNRTCGLLPAAALLAAEICAPTAHGQSSNEWRAYVPCAAVGEAETSMQRQLLSDDRAEQRYRAVFLYFARGFVQHQSPDFGRVQYCGAGSVNSFAVNGLEGFARTAPLLAAWLYSGRETTITGPAGGPGVDLVDVLKKGILSGVDPGSRDYWGAIVDNDQRIVEAADIARTLWLTKALIWERSSPREKLMIARWLLPATKAATPQNNWMLFPIVVDLVLIDLNAPGVAPDLAADAHREFAVYKRFYLQSGWFSDGSNGVDFYNAWGITYDLYWLHQVDATFETEFITKAVSDSAALTENLISPRGIPIMGRSICYRTAVPVPILAADLQAPGDATRGRALHALDAVWRYFAGHGAIREGALTQGYFAEDLRFLDEYSGGGSCQWGLRSLVLAFMHGTSDHFWSDPPAPLPVELSDYRIDYPKLGWRVAGHVETGEITVEISANSRDNIRPHPYTEFDRFLETIRRRPFRPRNHEIKYESRVYSSAHPFPALPP
jgi:hypothetical protein